MTPEKVAYALQLLSEPNRTMASIARLRGVSRSTLYAALPEPLPAQRDTAQLPDPATQRLTSQEICLHSDGTWRMLPSTKRYASPAELDLMAELAGLRLCARYGGWDRSPFTSHSTRHVSVYEPRRDLREEVGHRPRWRR